MDNPFDIFAEELQKEKERFSKLEKDPSILEKKPVKKDPLFRSRLAQNEDEAKKLNLSTPEGIENVKQLALKEQRLKEWSTG